MIDSERMMELEREIGAEDLRLILDVFLDEADQTLTGIEAGTDPKAMTRAMHFLRSGALNMGLRGFAVAAGAIEGERCDDPVAAADRLGDILRRTRDQLRFATVYSGP